MASPLPATRFEKARNTIIDTILIETCKSLDIDRPMREWLEFLIDIFRPSRDHIQTEARKRYYELVYQNPRTKIRPWLKQWKAIMAQAVRYDMEDIKGVVWFQDLAARVASIDNTIAILLNLESRREENRVFKRFREVAGQFQEDLTKTAKTKITAAGYVIQDIVYEVYLGDE